MWKIKFISLITEKLCTAIDNIFNSNTKAFCFELFNYS